MADNGARDTLLTIEQAAKYLSVSKSSLRRWTNEGRLGCVRVGARRERRFSKHELDRFVARTTNAELTDTSDVPRMPGDPDAPLEYLVACAEQGIPRHVCVHHRDRDELWRLFRPYVDHHLGQDAPVVFIHDPDATSDVRTRLARDGWKVEDLERRDLLRLRTPAQTYLRAGSFSAERMIDFLESVILDYRSMGLETVLISGEMTWSLTGAKGVEEMIPYEAMINGLLDRYPGATIVCHYDMRRLDPETHFQALNTHPHVHLPDRMVPGYYQHH